MQTPGPVSVVIGGADIPGVREDYLSMPRATGAE
jgi:hypothetical protein